MSDLSYHWIESTSWELPFFGLPNRIPWPTEVPDEVATRSPFEMEHMLDAIDRMGAEIAEPWASFRKAAELLDDLADALEDTEVGPAAQLIGEFEKRFPGTSFALYHLGVVARLEGREDDALRLFREAADKTERVPALWNNVGMLLAMRGERDEAIAAFKRVLAIAPRDATALEGLAQLRAIVKVVRDPNKPNDIGYVDIPSYGRLMLQQLNACADDPNEMLEQGEKLMRDGLFPDLGLKALERADQLRPNDARTLMSLAAAFRVAKKPDKSLENLVRYTELSPEDSRGFFLLAQAYSDAGNHEAERAALEKVLELDPNAQPALAIYFDLSPTEHDPEKEKALTAFAEKRQSCMGFILASDLARRRADHLMASKWAARACETNPDSEEALLQYAMVIGEARDLGKLANVIKPKVESGKFSNRLDWVYAQVLHQVGLPKDAIAALRKAIAGPDVPDDFKQQANQTIDAWSGFLTGSGLPLEVHQTGYLIRPLLLALQDGDGGVVIQAGAPLPASASFPWRANGTETRVSMRQGQSGGETEPRGLGSFMVRGIQPEKGAPGATIECHVMVQRDGAIHFRATQGGTKLTVGWTPSAKAR